MNTIGEGCFHDPQTPTCLRLFVNSVCILVKLTLVFITLQVICERHNWYKEGGEKKSKCNFWMSDGLTLKFCDFPKF